MQSITSAQNPTIKHLRKLATSTSYRGEVKQTILDGIHLAQSYLATGSQPVLCVVNTESLRNSELQSIIGSITGDIIEVPGSLFKSFSSLQNGVGLSLVIQTVSQENPNLQTSALLIDNIQDPGNLGSMLRTAAAAGLQNVYISAGSADAWSPKTLRAGMGAHFALNIYESVDLRTLIEDSSVPVYATSLNGQKSLYECDLTGESAWLFGNEGKGVNPELVAMCGDNTVIIPQNPKVESLNMAAATAVCLFEQRRQQNLKS